MDRLHSGNYHLVQLAFYFANGDANSLFPVRFLDGQVSFTIQLFDLFPSMWYMHRYWEKEPFPIAMLQVHFITQMV